ncbi:MAG: glutamate synthase subunit beta [Deltaproteobacteria bacterium]|nr:glutamate synthase subunit beta [Deltaproteobacteria bacterium]
MGDPRGFLKVSRERPTRRPALERLKDFDELGPAASPAELVEQASRCMDCGVPFCQSDTGCPLGNRIPEWNDLVYQGRLREALARLHDTNNFPEVTGRVCPAPCEGACTVGLDGEAVTIEEIERALGDRGFEEGWIVPRPAQRKTGKRVSVVGSGPAGLAAAQQLARAGHEVVVYERADRAGGLLVYGIPNMKLDKRVLARRLAQLEAEGVEFVLGCEVGRDIRPDTLREESDAVLLATGSTLARDLELPGRELAGVHLAMDYLTASTKALLDETACPPHLDAKGKRVLVIGGGDTGTDCIATALRQGATSVVNLELMPRPPDARADDNPWPEWPRIFRVDYGHEEAAARFGEDPRSFGVSTLRFLEGEKGQLGGVELCDVSGPAAGFAAVEGSERRLDADLVFLALGFVGVEPKLATAFGVAPDTRGRLRGAPTRFTTGVPGLYAAGDCRRGQSLVVWAIAEGRAAARVIDEHLMGETELSAPEE